MAFPNVTRIYRDRAEAGLRLAEALQGYRGKHALVLGIPRGGVPVAAELARGIDADLDVVVARKLGAPEQPELAIGAVTANGGLYLDQETIDYLGISEDYVTRVIERESAEARRREQLFRGNAPPLALAGRVVIVADDGLATGATMRAAVHSVAKRKPSRLIAAIPVGSEHACDLLRKDVNEVVCLEMPQPFWAVGMHYEDFDAVEDEEVARILRDVRKAPASPPYAGHQQESPEAH